MSPHFRRLTEHELQDLLDEDVIAYLRDARRAGAIAAARLALQVLAFGYWDVVAARVALKLPARRRAPARGGTLCLAAAAASSERQTFWRF